MTATNKRLLISESHGDSNWCTLCRGKSDQHVTRFPRLVRVLPKTIRISRGSHIAILRTVVNRFEQIQCTREEGFLIQSTARRLIDSRVRTQLLSHNSPWSSGKKSSFCWHLTTRLTRHISPACNRYVQYLLAGATTMEVPVYHISLPDPPNQLSPLSPKGPSDLQVNQVTSITKVLSIKITYGRHVVFRPLDHLP
jgi:hypothetical protein